MSSPPARNLRLHDVRPATWRERYSDRYRPRKIHVPGSPDGRIGRVTLFERNGNIQLRWRDHRKNQYESVLASEHENPMGEALARAAEISRALEERRASHRSFQKATVREAVELFLGACESSPDCSAATIAKYRSELSRVVEFATDTKEGRRCRYLHSIDTAWCEAFVRWLDVQRPRPRGGRAGVGAPGKTGIGKREEKHDG